MCGQAPHCTETCSASGFIESLSQCVGQQVRGEIDYSVSNGSLAGCLVLSFPCVVFCFEFNSLNGPSGLVLPDCKVVLCFMTDFFIPSSLCSTFT